VGQVPFSFNLLASNNINPLGNIARKSRLTLPHIKIVLAKAPVLIGVKNALYFD
jgi:hypothetical protein